MVSKHYTVTKIKNERFVICVACYQSFTLVNYWESCTFSVFAS